jgi:hypothetical protein
MRSKKRRTKKRWKWIAGAASNKLQVIADGNKFSE